MVVHVGIDAKEGVAAVYNGVTEIKQRFKVSRIYDDDDVDDMFKELKAKIGEEELLGFCCVSLKSKHKNEVRKKLIKTGKEIGFKKIQIISCESAEFIELTSKMGNKFQTNDVIWFLCDESCSILKKGKTSLKFLEDHLGDYSKGEGFQK